METLKRIALALIIVGAINWGLIGFFSFDLVAFIFNGQQSLVSRFIYALVGLSGLYALTIFFTGMRTVDEGPKTTINNPSYSTEMSDEFNNLSDNNDRLNNHRHK